MRVFLAVLSITAFIPAIAFACITAWPGNDMPPKTSAERSLIIWDAEKKHEDFIRSINFETSSKNLGFIVPVPSIPDVADIQSDIFELLDEEIDRQRPRPLQPDNSGDADPQAASMSASGEGQAEVVKEFKLAQYDVKVIKTESLAPLSEWLQDNKFALRPELKTWLQSYIDKKYYFTVFNFRSNEQDITAKAVRISFSSPAPYYPYKESDDTKTDSRELLLYFLSDAAYVPSSFTKDWGYNECLPAHRWLKQLMGEETAYPKFSNQIGVINGLKDLVDFNKLNYLTVWVDKTQKRPSIDLNFSRDNRFGRILPCPDKD